MQKKEGKISSPKGHIIDLSTMQSKNVKKEHPLVSKNTENNTTERPGDGNFAEMAIPIDIKIQRKKHKPSLIQFKVKRQSSEDVGDQDNSSSLIEEQEEESPKKSLRSPVMIKSSNLGLDSNSNSKSLNQSLAKEFRNYKRITSLDEFYVQNNHFKKNPTNPYKGPAFDMKKEGFLVEVLEARFLPDTVNFVKAKIMIYGAGEGPLSPIMSSVMFMDGDINQATFDLLLKVQSLKTSNFDNVYLFILWETFQDIFGEDEVDFTPLVFGFSLVKLFQIDKEIKSESGVTYFNEIWNICEGPIQIGIYPSHYLKLDREEIIKRYR